VKADKEPREAPFVDNSYKWAGGGFLSTPSDLVRFGSAHLKPGFLSGDSLETLFTSQTLKNGDPTNYGIGWRILAPNEEREHAVYLRGGSSVGGRAILAVGPDSGLVVAMLANVSDHPDIGRDNAAIAGAFTDALLAGQLDGAR
jgi:CubicO group peptidase (beta-lactamase class C family)